MLGGAGQEKKESVLSPYGPVRAGLTTSHRTQTDQQLTELLSDLEKQVATLIYKSSKVLDIFTNDILPLVERSLSTTDTNFIEEN